MLAAAERESPLGDHWQRPDLNPWEPLCGFRSHELQKLRDSDHHDLKTQEVTLGESVRNTIVVLRETSMDNDN